jgi:hypothetical protein
MSVQLAHPVQTDSIIWLLTPEGEDIPGVVRYCNSVEHGCHVGFRRVGQADKRVNARKLGAVRISWIDRQHRRDSSWVKISNAGDGILSVESPDEFPSPAIVSVAGSEYCSLGIARFYRKDSDRCVFEVETITDAIQARNSAA